MRKPGKAALRFVRALLACDGRVEGDDFVAGDAKLAAAIVRQLASDGVIAADDVGCRALPGTSIWLKRQLLETDAFAAQHRTAVTAKDGITVNLAESPLARLAAPIGGTEAYLRPHQVEAGERLRRLVERALLRQRVTMSYAAVRATGGNRRDAAEITNLAADARRILNDLLPRLPPDCAGVLLDVCGFDKGLQQVEAERGWPRRSAKLVLRIGLDRLAELWGLGAVATGVETRRRHAFMDGARVPMFE